MGCKVQYGVQNVCGDIVYPSGADATFWVGYVSDLSTRFSTTQSAAISSLSFVAYAGLVKFEGQKFSHVFSSETQVGAGGNISYLHKAAVKVIGLSTQDDVEIQRLTQSIDAFIIYQNNNDQFFILGPSKGLRAVAGPLQSTGQGMGDDITDNVTLEGVEKVKPLRFFVTDVATTISYLNARVI